MSERWLDQEERAPRYELLRAVAWCSARASAGDRTPEHALRSQELKPPLFGYTAASSVWWLCSTRVHALGDRRPPVSVPTPQEVAKGRLLLFDNDHTTFMQACWAASHGLIDLHDVPPWDAWVFHFEDLQLRGSDSPATVLASWIPQRYVPLADAAVDESVEWCLQWADELPETSQKVLLDALALDALPCDRGERWR